jgi:hypothetical protein
LEKLSVQKNDNFFLISDLSLKLGSKKKSSQAGSFLKINLRSELVKQHFQEVSRKSMTIINNQIILIFPIFLEFYSYNYNTVYQKKLVFFMLASSRLQKS